MANLVPSTIPPSLLSIAGLNDVQQQMQDAAAEWDQHVRGMQDQANRLFGSLQQTMNAPVPQASPMSQFFANLLGNTSQVLAPNMGGQQIAQQTINNANQSALQRRQERLSMLRDSYDRMAKAAMDSGNDMLQAKLDSLGSAK